MTGFDFVVAGILSLSFLLGIWRGLIHELMALLGWPFAFVLCKMFAGDIAPLLPLNQETVSMTVAYALIFVAVLILWSVLTKLLSRLLKAAGLDWPDRVMGGMFGILRGGLILLVMIWMVGLTDYYAKPFWRDALTTEALEDAALATRSWLPDGIAKRIHYGSRK